MDIENFPEQIDDLKARFVRAFYSQALTFGFALDGLYATRAERDEARRNHVEFVLDMLECRHVFMRDHTDTNLEAARRFLDLQLPDSSWPQVWQVEFIGGLEREILYGECLDDIPLADAMGFTCASELWFTCCDVNRWAARRIESVRRMVRRRLAGYLDFGKVRVSVAGVDSYQLWPTLMLRVEAA